jgi:hypothetical protein
MVPASCRGDEDDAAEIERHVEVVVAEGAVLLGIEHLEHGRRRIAMDAGAHLVDLVQHHHAVAAPALRIVWMMLPGSAPI